MEVFTQNGAEIYVVGGAVRDLLIDLPVKDWDFATNITPEKMKEMFPANSFCNNAFGTFSVVKGKDIYEITTYRTERGYSDSRHPDTVAWGKSLEEDLQRRDFTINAIAMDIDGKLYDFYDGLGDLKNKTIRCVGNPDNRFSEDALRMMRAIRIAAQIGFLIEENTFVSIQKNAKLINNIAGERIRDELFKLLASNFPTQGVILLKNAYLLAEIIPEMLMGVGMTQKGHHIYDVWSHGLNALQNCSSSDPITRLATLIHDIGKPNSMKIIGTERTFHNHEVIGARISLKLAERLHLSKKQRDQLYRLVRWHMFTVSEIQTDKAVRRFIKNVTPEYIDEMIALRRSDRLGSGSKETSWRWELFKKRIVEVQKQPFAIKDLKVNGGDVMKILSIKPGPMVGKILCELFAQVEEDPKLNKRMVLLKKIKQFF